MLLLAQNYEFTAISNITSLVHGWNNYGYLEADKLIFKKCGTYGYFISEPRSHLNIMRKKINCQQNYFK